LTKTPCSIGSNFLFNLTRRNQQRKTKSKEQNIHSLACTKKSGNSSTMRDLGPNGVAETVSMAMKLRKEEAYQRKGGDDVKRLAENHRSKETWEDKMNGSENPCGADGKHRPRPEGDLMTTIR